MTSRRSDEPRHPVSAIDPAPLIGEWINYDVASSNIARLSIFERGHEIVLRVFGVPSVDWGETTLQPFALTVAGGEEAAFRAAYDFSVVRIAILAYLNKRLLVVDIYSTFHDDSGRSNYFTRDHFYL